jgi:hypothetical protein
MFLVPLLTGFCVSRLIAEPAFEFMQQRSPMAFAPNDRQKVGKLLLIPRLLAFKLTSKSRPQILGWTSPRIPFQPSHASY